MNLGRKPLFFLEADAVEREPSRKARVRQPRPCIDVCKLTKKRGLNIFGHSINQERFFLFYI